MHSAPSLPHGTASALNQQYEQMLEDLVDTSDCEARPLALGQDKIEKALHGDRNFSISCELGVLYPTMMVMLNREDLPVRLRVTVSLFSSICLTCAIY